VAQVPENLLTKREDLSSNTRIAKKKILKFFPLNIITNNSFDNFLGGTLG
jgi:hypothetical protein